MTFEYNIFEFIVDKFSRRVVVALYFITDYFYFSIYFSLWINAVKYDIGNVIELDGKYTVDVTASPLQFSTVLEDEEFNKEAEETVKGAMKDDPNIGDKELMAALTGTMALKS